MSLAIPTSTISARLAALRTELAALEVDAFIIPRSDENLGEYVPLSAERLAWITGFTGSAGIAIVSAHHAAVFSDGRYTIQLQKQVDPELFEHCHILSCPPAAWLRENAGGGRIGFDPKLMSRIDLAPFVDADLDLIPLDVNPIDRIWSDKPSLPPDPIVPHPLEYSGLTSSEKRSAIGDVLRDAGEAAVVLTDPASIAWLLNVRGGDVPFTPFPVGFALAFDDGRVDLFVDPEKVSTETERWLGNAVRVRSRDELNDGLREMSGRRVRIDGRSTPVWFAQELLRSGATVTDGPNPCLVPKACKNETEQAGMRRAHIRDGLAVTKFLHFMSEAGPLGSETEMSAVDKLVAFRSEAPEFVGQSFAAISAAGEHGAINHYRVSEESNRRINPNELYLIDSGAQYLDGTTDVTRTIWTGKEEPPSELRDRYTRVLQGLISLDTLVFPAGSAGVHIDAFARRALWEIGLDYDHGTGHGVGSYLAVHEGPASISRPLRPDPLGPGMVMSNEPGYYVTGAYGIRLENLILVLPAHLPQAEKSYLRFESITLAPFERRLIDKSMLSAKEVEWVDMYHRRVVTALRSGLSGAVADWLVQACEPL